MGRRLTRKQIKHDEFVTLVDKLVHWMGENWRQSAAAAGGVVVLALLWWGGTALLGSRQDAASVALTKAIDMLNAPVGSAAPAAATVKFATEAAKLEEAEKAFSSVKSHYWLTPQARLARFYLACIQAERGDSDAAIRAMGAVAGKRTATPAVRLAMLDLVNMRLARSDARELIPSLQAMVDGKDPRLPPDAALYELGRIQENSGNHVEAAQLYRKLLDEFPSSPYRNDAQQRLSGAS